MCVHDVVRMYDVVAQGVHHLYPARCGPLSCTCHLCTSLVWTGLLQAPRADNPLRLSSNIRAPGTRADCTSLPLEQLVGVNSTKLKEMLSEAAQAVLDSRPSAQQVCVSMHDVFRDAANHSTQAVLQCRCNP